MGAVQNFNSDFVGANSSTLYLPPLRGWTTLSSQAQMGEKRDKNCSYCTRHSGQDFCAFGALKLKKLHYFFGTFTQEKLVPLHVNYFLVPSHKGTYKCLWYL
jgi:hypothetical protein